MTNVVCAAIAAVVGVAASAQGSLVFSSNFSTFTPGNLVGQGGWTDAAAGTGNPIQVAAGMVVIPGGQTTNAQDARQAFAPVPLTAGQSFYGGFSVRVNSAPSGGDGSSYFVALEESSAGFDNARVVARQVSATTFQLGLRATGQSGNSFTFGAPLNYGQTYNVIVAWDAVAGTANDVLYMFVNAPAGPRNNANAYVVNNQVNATGDAPGFNGFVFSQFGSSTLSSADAMFGRAAAATSYEAIAGFIPAPGTMALMGLAGLAAARRRRA
jgi:hypothetical protein